MDLIFEAALSSHDSDYDEIPQTKEPVWILGRKYDSVKESDNIRSDIKSRLWFSYRKGFIPIGDSGHTSDKGWGCMLRCGQMLIAQALLCLHLGRDWQWRKECRDPDYLRILKMFEDKRTATYSIHQIALMGVSEGIEIGQWFGPNTVTQVLKKLAVYDKWSSLAIHVALDNTIVANDIRALCRQPRSPESNNMPHRRWKPLLLVVPVRLGLSDVNPVYIRGLKTCFSFRQSLGVIGGKPNHALYFIGYVGDQVIYLDPHTTQPVGCVQNKEQSYEKIADQTYHCPKACRTNIVSMDPSVAVCFFCATEPEFEILCQQIQERLVKGERQPLFEVVQNRPTDWTDRAEDALSAQFSDSCEMSRSTDNTDEDFVLLG